MIQLPDQPRPQLEFLCRGPCREAPSLIRKQFLSLPSVSVRFSRMPETLRRTSSSHRPVLLDHSIDTREPGGEGFARTNDTAISINLCQCPLRITEIQIRANEVQPATLP